MGAILEPTSRMGHFLVEVRAESAYVSADLGEYNAWVSGERSEPPARTVYGHKGVGFAVRPEDTGHVLAAIDQVMRHPAYLDWTVGNMPKMDAAAGRWRCEFTDGLVRAYGPVIVAGDPEPWAPVGAVELAYEDVAALMLTLAVEHHERTGRDWSPRNRLVDTEDPATP